MIVAAGPKCKIDIDAVANARRYYVNNYVNSRPVSPSASMPCAVYLARVPGAPLPAILLVTQNRTFGELASETSNENFLAAGLLRLGLRDRSLGVDLHTRRGAEA